MSNLNNSINNDKEYYVSLIKEAIEDGSLTETEFLNEAIYIIDDIKISGDFDCGIRGTDHNVLNLEDQSWADILQWGTLVVPETESYISNTPICELEALGYINIPLGANHKYQCEEVIEQNVQLVFA
ncbi:hypothetical protein QYM42_08595 [Lactococcus lactis]|uniref:hypothetical protein n=1 Tax=Lactococcus lactis TaxID=1358 RepID=UPI0026587D85|nr:hypothetical protein [Lactococcus lactis]WKF72436.1 hypothetical protein QYM42_08595 [Lactococcus lactis]